MSNLKEGNELKEARRMKQHWRETAGVLVDVIRLLSNVARLEEHNLSQREKDRLFSVTRSAALVASHTLRPVLEELNLEELRYWQMDRSNFLFSDLAEAEAEARKRYDSPQE